MLRIPALASLLLSLATPGALARQADPSAFGGEPASWSLALDPDPPTLRFGAPGDTPWALDLDLVRAARWEELPGGGRVGRLRLGLPGALALRVAFARFQLPPGASLFLYDDERAHLLGAYTELSPDAGGRLEAPPLPGAFVTLEVHEPADAAVEPELVVAGLWPTLELLGRAPLVAAASSREGERGQRGRGGTQDSEIRSPPCNVDVACEQGRGWELASRSVVSIVALNEFCTGVLINNTANDGTPFVLTARHCGSLNLATFRFDWRRAECGVGDLPPQEERHEVSGSRLVFAGEDHDFQLVRLPHMPPEEWGAVYAGWDRSDRAPEHTACLHHPGGDLMKISLDEQAPGKRRRHWNIARWETGMTARGSSGAPLFDPQSRVIGTLEGGDATCKDPRNDSFLRLSRMWSQLGPVLDPLETGAEVLDALDLTGVVLPFAITGTLPETIPVGTTELVVLGSGFSENVKVHLDGERVDWREVELLSNSRLRLDVPPLTEGRHWLKIWKRGESADLRLTVVGPDPEPPVEDA